jgi:hypothetical protein
MARLTTASSLTEGPAKRELPLKIVSFYVPSLTTASSLTEGPPVRSSGEDPAHRGRFHANGSAWLSIIRWLAISPNERKRAKI